jgi:electron transfer flavoprotein alpha subunit
VCALFVGDDILGAESAANFGADAIIKIESPMLSSYSSDLFASAISSATKAKNANILLLGATSVGKDIAPRVAARLGAGLAADATALCIKDGRLQATRPIYAGKALATVDFATEIQIATTRPNVFALVKVPKEGAMEFLPAPSEGFKSIVKEIIAKGSEKLDLTESDVIVSGGRGMKDGANFKLLEELAEALGGVVGASRAAVDAGWNIPHSAQVGQTGKVVSPTLYVACGISGAIQHLAGISGSKYIVAVNKDPDAPIFKVADYGIVGDLFEVVPELTK